MKIQTALIAGVVAIIGIVVAGVVILSRDISENARLIIVQGMIGAILSLIPVLIGAVKAENAATKTAEIHHELRNGLISEKVKEGITEVAADPTSGAVYIAAPHVEEP